MAQHAIATEGTFDLPFIALKGHRQADDLGNSAFPTVLIHLFVIKVMSKSLHKRLIVVFLDLDLKSFFPVANFMLDD